MNDNAKRNANSELDQQLKQTEIGEFFLKNKTINCFYLEDLYCEAHHKKQ